MKKQKDKNVLHMTTEAVSMLQKDLSTELDTNPEYSLSVDPLDKYKMPEQQKKFIEYYVQFKNVATAAELAHIEVDDAKDIFVKYDTQQEIRRINRALYQRQFSSKLLSLDEIGGYLSSLLTDECVPIVDQLKPMDKVRVAQMIIDLIKLKDASIQEPSKLSSISVEDMIKNLSITTISQLLEQSRMSNETIDKINNSELSVEEKSYLNSLPTEEVLKLLDETNKGD